MNDLRCNTKYIGKQYVWLEETDSTNSLMKRLLDEGTTVESGDGYGVLIEGNPVEGLMLLSNKQTAGRGRSGHTWSSPSGSSIALSVLLRPQTTADEIPMITLIAAMAVASAIDKASGVNTTIKWPNDVLIGDKKVCGILTELDIRDNVKSLIVGIGVNISQESFPEEIEKVATSLLIETGLFVDKEVLAGLLAEELEKYYELFLETKDMSKLKDEYSSKLVNMDKEVKVLDPSMNITGIARGIDSEGQLLVETSDGVIHHIYAGEVSVRGIYGYV